jgi:hypothetical protein
MPMVEHHATDGSGRVFRRWVSADAWHRGNINGSEGPQHRWYYFTTDSLGKPLAMATIYEDRNPYRKLKLKKRLYRWDVFPAGVGYSYARGECVSLQGAKRLAEACANATMFIMAKPYNEKVHKR